MGTANTMNLSDDDNEFTVSDRDEIVLILNGLAVRNIGVSAIFNGGADVLLTEVLGVDASAGVAYLDVNANEERSRQFQAAAKAFFVAYADGAKTQWATAQIEEARFEGRQAFRIPLPVSLRRIQRRNFFRVSTPTANPVICHIPIAPDRIMHLPLVDVCVEGIGVVLLANSDPAFEKNVRFANCRIEHDDLQVAGLTLSVQSIWNVTQADGVQVRHAGLEFSGITRAAQDLIQHFVFKLERQQIAQNRNRRL
jgi:c-di-GMP-binding flagellar brake protein YcgR